MSLSATDVADASGVADTAGLAKLAPIGRSVRPIQSTVLNTRAVHQRSRHPRSPGLSPNNGHSLIMLLPGQRDGASEGSLGGDAADGGGAADARTGGAQ